MKESAHLGDLELFYIHEDKAQSIVKMFPNHSRIELFARDMKPGYDVWGLDVIYREAASKSQ